MKLHNQILKQFLSDYSGSVYGRELAKHVDASQKGVALELNRLEHEHVLKSKRVGNIKYFSLNLRNPAMRDMLATAEIAGKIDFLERNPLLSNIFGSDDRIVGVFGSYADGTQDKASDLDIFIIGKKQEEDYVKKGRMFDVKVSIKYFSEDDFVRPNPLVKEIIRKHVVIFHAEAFVDLLWRAYYGFD